MTDTSERIRIMENNLQRSQELLDQGRISKSYFEDLRKDVNKRIKELRKQDRDKYTHEAQQRMRDKLAALKKEAEEEDRYFAEEYEKEHRD